MSVRGSEISLGQSDKTLRFISTLSYTGPDVTHINISLVDCDCQTL